MDFSFKISTYFFQPEIVITRIFYSNSQINNRNHPNRKEVKKVMLQKEA